MSAMTIPLRSLVPDLDPTQYKLHCAVWNGEEQPLDVFARSREEWAGWNSWRGARNDFNRPFIFSMMQVHYETNRWLFGGVFEVLARRPKPHARSYDVRLREEVLPGCIGRLKLSYRPAGRAMRLKLERALDDIEVDEILKTPYAGQPFPGLDSINHSLGQIEVAVSQQRQDWRGPLENMKGVYVIHDRVSGKRYVGSAYGDEGIWARWEQYAASRHGGNIDLRDLVARKGDDYARENLFFALLEYWSPRTDDEFILDRENYWKGVLFSRQFGHNKN